MVAGSFNRRLHQGNFHSVLHRTYAHGYPQAVSDFSQLGLPVGRRLKWLVFLLLLTRETTSSLTALRLTSDGGHWQRQCTPKGA